MTRWLLPILIVLTSVFSSARPTLAAQAPIALPAVGSTTTATSQDDANQPLAKGVPMFVENTGQWNASARFQMWGGPGTVWLSENAIWITLVEGLTEQPAPRQSRRRTSEQESTEAAELAGVSLRLSFQGANSSPRLEPFGRLKTAVSYFSGANPNVWRADVPVWTGIRYVDLYPDVDLIIGADTRSVTGILPWRLEARPNADLAAVRLRVEGAEDVALAEQKDALHLRTMVGDLALPLLRPNDLGGAVEIQARGGQVFDVAGPLITTYAKPASMIDSPQSDVNNLVDLIYGTYLGGTGSELGRGIVVTDTGHTYITGYTSSSDFPTTPGAYQPTLNDGSNDIFVAKLNPEGAGMIFVSYIGGSNDDRSNDIAVDSAGDIYVTGYTNSSDFPITSSAFDASYDGDRDAFVVKLNDAGSELTYSTFLGGDSMSSDMGWGIAVDGSGNAYVTGGTHSSLFPTTSNALDTSYNGDRDGFVAKLNPEGSALGYSTFLGGDAYDHCFRIAVDSSGSAYVAGNTYSSNFPTTPFAFDTTYNGDSSHDNAFAVKLDPTGSSLTYRPLAPRRGIVDGDLCPTDDVEEIRNVFGPPILILEIVGVLPDVHAQNWRVTGRDRAILVGRAVDFEAARGLYDEPAPTAAEPADCRCT